MNSAIRTVFRHLLRQIMEGRLSPGDLLPTETALAEEFGTTRMNVFRAIEQLKLHGLVVRRKRAGTTLTSSTPDPELLRRLFNESSKIVYLLLSRNPRGIHWSRATLSALAQTLKNAGYGIRRIRFPENSDPIEFQRILDRATADGAAALVIFPDTGDETLLRKQIPRLLATKTPIMILHRSDDLDRLDFASSVVIDHFSDGIRLGTLLRRNGVRNAIILRNSGSPPVWSRLRMAGLKIGLCGSGESTNGFPSECPVFLEEFHPELSGAERIFTKIREDRNRELFFIAINDEYAAAFIALAQKHGLSAGCDYHLAAFDDNPKYRSLGISTMHVPQKQIGELFGRMICENSWYHQYPVHVSVRVESQFIQRKSCRKLK